MPEAASWDLFFLLPNLCPKKVPSPFTTEYLAICFGEDPLLKHVANTSGNATALAMRGKYHNWFGKSYVPGCVVVRSDAPKAVRDADTLRAFRNLCAAATISSCCARKLTGGQWLPLYSDHFLFASHVAGKNGWIQNMDGPVGGMNDDVEHFVGQCAGQIDAPQAFSVSADPVLLKKLIAAWEVYCLKKRRRDELSSIFRSLVVAFHAARFPSDGLSSINDAGTRVGLWVSALEILAHPGPGDKADKQKVQALLGRVKLHDKSLKRRRYKVSVRQEHVHGCSTRSDLRRPVRGPERFHARQSSTRPRPSVLEVREATVADAFGAAALQPRPSGDVGSADATDDAGATYRCGGGLLRLGRH